MWKLKKNCLENKVLFAVSLIHFNAQRKKPRD